MKDEEFTMLMQALLSKNASEGELRDKLRMPPGCQLERKCEDRMLPISSYYIHRNAGRFINCDDPANNSDWVWSGWLDGPC